MLSRQAGAVAAATVLLAVACGTGGNGSRAANPPSGMTHGAAAESSSRGSPYRPAIDRSRFRTVVDNAWFPLKPGTTFLYRGVKDGEPSRDVYAVTGQTRTIDGAPCVVVHDSLYLSGSLAEETYDYYTQDLQGNVWYFGEDTKELNEKGEVTSTEGTWHAGVDGAQPGIFMEANPGVGHRYRQEYYRGQAEDQYRVVSLSTPITVPYGSFQTAQLTEEWTALEPETLDHKYYVRGIGEVAELSVRGPQERALLVSVTAG